MSRIPGLRSRIFGRNPRQRFPSSSRRPLVGRSTPATIFIAISLFAPLAILFRYSLNDFIPTKKTMVEAVTVANYVKFFTDPFYKRDWWDYKDRPQDGEHVYFLAADRKSLKRVTTDLVQPNGIIGTPDGKMLFVADIRARKTYAYDIRPDGSLANKRLRCELGSDGMTLDEAGNLYLTGKGVIVFDKTGKQIEHIDVPENWTANVSFGGKDHKKLFITASTGLYSIRTQHCGANAAKL